MLWERKFTFDFGVWLKDAGSYGEKGLEGRARDEKKRLFTHFCVAMLLKKQGRSLNKPTFKPTFGLKISATKTKHKRKTNPPNPLLGPFLSVSY